MANYMLTLKLNGLLSDGIPDTCECHFGLLTYGAKDDFSTTVCTNPDCYTHRAYFITDALAILGIKASIGPETAAKILGDCNLKSHLDLFDDTIINMDNESYGKYMIPVYKAQRELQKINESGGIKLGTYISLLFYPSLGKTRSEALFSEYSDLQIFYQDLITPQPDDFFNSEAYTAKSFISRKIGVSYDSDTVINIYKTLMKNREELERCIKYFKIIQINSTSATKVLHIVITGSITRITDDNGDSFRNRDDFPNYITKKYGVNLIQDGTVKLKNPPTFLVCDEKPQQPGDSEPTSSKYAKAKIMKPKLIVAELMLKHGISDDNIVVTSKELMLLLDNGLLDLKI